MNFNINLLIYRIAPVFHFICTFIIVYFAEITIKTPIFWALLLNNLMCVYFVFISGAAFGIKQTIIRLSAEEIKKIKDQEDNFDDFKNN